MRWSAFALAVLLVIFAAFWGDAHGAVVAVTAEPYAPDEDELSVTAQKEEAVSGNETPRVLIYHTHTHEAYAQGSVRYAETGAFRTADAEFSVVRVGKELARILQEDYGIGVLHDTADYEPPKLGTAYVRSLTGLKQYMAEYPELQLCIDLHRDAYSKGLTRNVDGQYAPLMLVVGNGVGFSTTWDWEKNQTLAQNITDALNLEISGLCRKLRVKNGRYNQHISSGCILVEVGHNENTLQEALTSMVPLAKVLAGMIS